MLNNNQKLIICFLFCYILGNSQVSALKKTKDCDIEKPIRKCLKMGFLFDANGHRFEDFPTTLAGVNDACEELKRSEECSREFIGRCTDSSYEERVMGHMIEGRVRVMKRLCRTNTRKNELLKHVKCANAVIDDTYRCVGDYKKLVYAANKLNDKNKILRILCCKIREVVPCVGKAMRAKGAGTCSNENIEYFRNMQQQVKEEMTSVLCADYERDNCENVEVPAVSDSEYSGKALYEPMRQLYNKVLH